MREGQISVEAKITQVELGESSNENVQLLLSFATPECPHFQTITKGFFFTDAALESTEKALTDLGWNPGENNWDVDGLIESKRLVGQVVSLVCEEEEYKGKLSWRVKFVNRRGGMKTTYDKAARRMFGEKLRATKAKKAEPRSDKDGIPF